MEHLHDLEHNGESWDLRMSKKNQSWTVVKYYKLILFRVMVVLVVKRLTCLPMGETRVRSGRSPGGGNDNPLQYACLENSRDRGAWRSTVHGVAESDMTEHAQESEFIAKEQSESQQIKDLLEETSGVKEVLAKLT